MEIQHLGLTPRLRSKVENRSNAKNDTRTRRRFLNEYKQTTKISLEFLKWLSKRENIIMIAFILV